MEIAWEKNIKYDESRDREMESVCGVVHLASRRLQILLACSDSTEQSGNLMKVRVMNVRFSALSCCPSLIFLGMSLSEIFYLYVSGSTHQNDMDMFKHQTPRVIHDAVPTSPLV